MRIGETAGFTLKSIIVGLAAAFIYLLFNPDALSPHRRVVEVQDAPAARVSAVSGPQSYADAVALASPAVVNIYTAKRVTRQAHPLFDDPLFRQFFGNSLGSREQIQTSLGSGVIVSVQGYLLTNSHVIEGADEIQAMLADGRSVQATVVGSDPESDVAVLHIDLADLPAIAFGNSEALRVGDVVLAIGNPFGVGQTVTQGIVSATGRTRLGINTFEDFIQTDAAINPGNSGGALINASGDLIGINTAIFSRSGGSQGIGFAIPAHLARDMMEQIIETGHVVRGWMGIETQEITPALAEALGLHDVQGVVVAGVLRNGPADVAGLKPGDVVSSIDGRPVTDGISALKLIAGHAPGSTIHLQGWRAGGALDLNAQVGTRPAVK